MQQHVCLLKRRLALLQSILNSVTPSGEKMKPVDRMRNRIFRMKFWAAVFILTIVTHGIISCSAPNKGIQSSSPGFEFVEATLSRDIEKKGQESIPLGQTTAFYTNDTEVIFRIKIANVSGTHQIRWDWHQADGSLYHSTGNQPIRIASGKYRKEMSLWHRISLYGEAAVKHPGRWRVNVSMNNDILASQSFEIKPEINIDKLPNTAHDPNSENWGVIIGIENYAKLPSVDYAEKDARLVYRYFHNILGIPEKNIITLIDSEATKGKLEGIFRSYLPLNLDTNATLFVYFAGHGVPSIKDGDAFLVTYDGEPRLIEYTGYKLATLYADIGNLPIKRSIVFIDGCFSGASSRSDKMLIAGARPALIKVEDMAFSSDKIISLTASQGDQLSNAYPEKEHGLFTYFMLSGIRGAADANGDEMVTLDELFAYVNVNVIAVSRRSGLEQTPDILPGVDGIDKIKISKALKE
jgi:hypothetical protein